MIAVLGIPSMDLRLPIDPITTLKTTGWRKEFIFSSGFSCVSVMFDSIFHVVSVRGNVIKCCIFWMNSAGSMDELDSRLSFELVVGDEILVDDDILVGDDIVVEDMVVQWKCSEDEVTVI